MPSLGSTTASTSQDSDSEAPLPEDDDDDDEGEPRTDTLPCVPHVSHVRDIGTARRNFTEQCEATAQVFMNLSLTQAINALDAAGNVLRSMRENYLTDGSLPCENSQVCGKLAVPTCTSLPMSMFSRLYSQ